MSPAWASMANSALLAWLRYPAMGIALAMSPVAGAEQVVCHYTYGGEDGILAAQPAASPYAVGGIRIGSFFRFRVVFQDKPADTASVKIYTYADKDAGPVLIHQATFPYPPTGTAPARYGFSGLHFVYEPERDGELQYWCGMEADAK